ncbi:lysophospholipase L1-like esterase [Angulomicrobium tetraedrale]|uniref:Lysophospholipase L1-like esterase n=1 Tax=Ancylobacter tetraedralis TaxID=217068 RepID=A0A839ZEY4_9HYPH|nr:GDSL-type esterase/lipase family protein [Ancylobacter tetraedralis]MBB3773216.1 lysophospholipase L1-like esterase [Ancylobacter tetraedralis]
MRASGIAIGGLAFMAVGLALAVLLAGRGLDYFFLERARLRLEPVFDRVFREANAALPQAGTPRLVIFGDSRAVQLRLDAPKGWQRVERAISGETTAQMRYRIAQDVVGLAPRAVVLFAGINDLVAAAALPGQAHAGLDATVANLTDFVRQARAAGIEVVLLTIVRPAAVRLIRWPIWPAGVAELVAAANVRLRALAGPGVTVIDADAMLSGGAAVLPARFATDEVHLSDEANAALRRAILAALPAD